MTCLEASVFPAPDSPVMRMDWLRQRTRPSTSLPFVSAMYLGKDGRAGWSVGASSFRIFLAFSASS